MLFLLALFRPAFEDIVVDDCVDVDGNSDDDDDGCDDSGDDAVDGEL